MAGVKKEIWTGMLLDSLRFVGTWAEGIADESRFVNNDVIHLTDLGADPDVLIDNTVYPIPVNSQVDTDIPIALKKLDTENTKVTDDELYALPYDKQGSVINKHRMALEVTSMQYGLYTIAPAANAADSPVLKTTGPNDDTGTRKRLIPADIVRLKRFLDDQNVPRQGRRLVLCNDHIEDLLLTSEVFRNQYIDIQSGRVLNLFGFEIYEDSYAPMYNTSTLARMAFGATPTTEKAASTAFWTNEVFHAKGSANMYYDLASQNPTMRESVVGFRMYHIMMPKKRRSQAAIVSDVNAV